MASNVIVDDIFDDESFDEELAGPAIARRPVKDTADLDITPMIDITFLLLIFFLVASTADVQDSVKLPGARHGKGVSQKTAIIITVAERGGPGSALVYLGDGTKGEPLPDDPSVQQEQIARAVQESVDAGKPTVLVKAARGVLHREVSRVAAAAGLVDDIQLHMAVMEVE
ncbi:MAG TPA: biopolymer transporter ExbD [Thermoguttaceae bacterium]|nr:biopolymer transporter ExbD [Thermoguttaceae bacterium]